ncbi:DUF488 family protein [Rhodococcus sp. D2-41]|uniref:DUF488 family protein n=1 Tax=Speluncibacter jeojiensis TaxID=2710754 RepID=A0A9X4M506_9ACTN|nr:DUF488 family protein [Rhodococcus sp. D2-41]MDG3012535.1 DUF488 family protein [Rhodococcus sp. D2-41]MDG3015348.1 DUF488 family protein [Corynebacteriales bacterium D3-21]
MGTIELVRAYDARGTQKHTPTFLVDRLWPRGIAKSDLSYDDWIKDVAPSTELRKWFGHDPEKYDGFRRRYLAELDDHADAARPILDAAAHGDIVLLYSAKDTEHNQAVVLRDWLEKHG